MIAIAATFVDGTVGGGGAAFGVGGVVGIKCQRGS